MTYIFASSLQTFEILCQIDLRQGYEIQNYMGDKKIHFCSGVFSTGAMGALAPTILGQSITVTSI